MLLGIPAAGTAPALPRIVGTDPGWDPDTLGGVTMALFTPGPHGEEGWGAPWSLHLRLGSPGLCSQELQPQWPQLAPSSIGNQGGPDGGSITERI